MKNIEPYIRLNRALSKRFENIRDIADGYVSAGYPAAPDPDECMAHIKDEVLGYYLDIDEFHGKDVKMKRQSMKKRRK